MTDSGTTTRQPSSASFVRDTRMLPPSTPPDENVKTQSLPCSSTSRVVAVVVGGTVARMSRGLSSAGCTLTLTASWLGFSTVTRDTTFGSRNAYAIPTHSSTPTTTSAIREMGGK